MTMTNQTILIIVAHPDDETYCSGSIAKLKKAGNKVILIIATEGNRGTITPAVKPGELAARRKEEMTQAAEVLGIDEVVWLGYEDGGLWNSPDLKEKMFRAVRQYKPDVVFTFDPWKKYDFHSDHQTIGYVATEAAYLSRCIWYYPEHMEEGLQGHLPREVYLFQPEEVNYTVDVTEFLQTKLQAASFHGSQAADAGVNQMMRMNEFVSTLTGESRVEQTSLQKVMSNIKELLEFSVEQFHKVRDSDLLI